MAEYYRQATFRGVGFEVTSRIFTSGRRLQVHEYPNKDKPYTEDLGRKAQNYNVTAFVIGRDYKSKKNALIRACQETGSGILVHPDYGTLEVNCESITVREESSSKRMAVIELVFVETGEKAVPEASIDYADMVSQASGKLTNSAKDSFASKFKLSDGIEGLTALLGSTSDFCTSVLENIGSGIGYAEGLTSDVQGAMNSVANTASFALSLKTSAKLLLNTPNALAAQFDTVLSSITSLATTANTKKKSTAAKVNLTQQSNPDSSSSGTNAILTAKTAQTASSQAFKIVRSLASKSNASENMSSGSEDARAEKAAMQRIEQLTKQIVVGKEAEVITAIDFDNAEEAETVLDTFLIDVDEIELFEPIEPEIEVVQSIRDLREKVVDYIREIVLELPRTKTIRLNENQPSVVVAYDLYEDPSRADEIVKRNKVQFPAFVPANRDLKVLTE